MKINVHNSEGIGTALDSAQVGSQTRMLTVACVQNAAVIAEKSLDALNVPRRFRAGAWYKLIAPGKRNKTRPVIASVATLRRGEKNWFLIEATRQPVGYYAAAERLVVTAAARDALMRAAVRALHVTEEEAATS